MRDDRDRPANKTGLEEYMVGVGDVGGYYGVDDRCFHASLPPAWFPRKWRNEILTTHKGHDEPKFRHVFFPTVQIKT